MLERLTSGSDIASHTERLLQRAEAAGVWPTPVDDIVAARELEEPEEGPFDRAVLVRAPKHLRDAVRLLGSGRIRAMLDRKERTVYVDPSVEHQGRRSFLRLHETCHDLFPWQSEVLAFADSDETLSPATRRLFEVEANQGAAELLFQRDRFARAAGEYRVDLGAVTDLANLVGASRRATLRRYAETHHRAVCGLVLQPSPVRRDPLTYRRLEVSMSPAWQQRFGSTWPKLLSADAFTFLTAIANERAEGDLIVSWPDVDQQPVRIRTEAAASRFAILVLLSVPKRDRFKRKRVQATAA